MDDDIKLKELGAWIRDLWVAARREFDLRTEGHPSTWGDKKMPKYDGGMKDGRHYKSVWIKIARFCLTHELMPAVLIQAIFYQRHALAPNPPEACSALALGKYVQYIAPGAQHEREERIKLEFNAERARCEAQTAYYKRAYTWDDETAYKYVLCDRCEPLSALFRYCLAINQGFEKIVEMYYFAARAQYLLLPHSYDKIWGEWIPNELKTLCSERKAKEEALVATK